MNLGDLDAPAPAEESAELPDQAEFDYAADLEAANYGEAALDELAELWCYRHTTHAEWQHRETVLAAAEPTAAITTPQPIFPAAPGAEDTLAAA